MIIFLVLFALFLVVYLLGCLVAYGMVTSEEAVFNDYTRVEILGYTLGSWGTVLAAAFGRIQ